ncbi:unnamed protein product [Gadus morhua 'NCC']
MIGLTEKDGEDTREVGLGILTRVVPMSVERLRDTVDTVHQLGRKGNAATSNNTPRAIIIQFGMRVVSQMGPLRIRFLTVGRAILCEWRSRAQVSEMGPLRIRCLTVGGAILCERRVRVQGSDMGPLRIRCLTVELSEAELILWAAPKRMRQLRWFGDLKADPPTKLMFRFPFVRKGHSRLLA